MAFTLGATSQSDGSITLDVSVSGTGFANLTALDLIFEFNPLITPTTVIPSAWVDSAAAPSHFKLPALINAPDWGQMVLTSPTVEGTRGFLEGRRPIGNTAPTYQGYGGQVVVRISLPRPTKPTTTSFSMAPCYLATPAGVDSASWKKARRGWFGAWQPNANWTGDYSYFLQSRQAIRTAGHVGTWSTAAGREQFNAVGILGNNVVSDIASGSLWFYADQAYFTPRLAPGISISTSVKRSVEWWLDNRTFKAVGNDLGGNFQADGHLRPIPTVDSPGQMIYYWVYSDFLDPGAAMIIAAWDYVDSTGDVGWLDSVGSNYWGTTPRLEQLEIVAGYLVKRINAAKLVAAFQDGTSLTSPDRGCSWWDAVASGNEDAFINALSYRAFRCLADLEFKKGNRNGKVRAFTVHADRLKDNYETRLLVTQNNAPTIAWWRDRAKPTSYFHGFHSPVINGIAIEYGLTSDTTAAKILNGADGQNTGLWNKVAQAGFAVGNPIGLPFNISPWSPDEYLDRDPGPFRQYQNGAVFAGHTLHPIVADRTINGSTGNGNTVLNAMLNAQATTALNPAFQNGTQYSALAGADFKTWTGAPAGYEGFLAENFAFLQALPLGVPYWRNRFYRPLHPMRTQNDFDYDLCGDIVWHNDSTGANMVWLMNGATLQTAYALPPGPKGNSRWVIEGIGDFDRDRHGDLLWRDSLGNTVVWFMVASGYISAPAPHIPASYLICGVTDFDNDGKADILQHDPVAGSVRVWHMDCARLLWEQVLPRTRKAPWCLIGTGDLDDDGHPDLVWRNLSSGANEVWFHSLGAYPSADPVSSIPTAWVLTGINDFDGDGKSDLLWRNTTAGENQLWLMNGSAVTAAAALPHVPAFDWSIVGVSDFDGDRRADIMWRDTSGNNALWFMNGGALVDAQRIPSLSSAWQVRLPQN